jgi:hypothetical protein
MATDEATPRSALRVPWGFGLANGLGAALASTLGTALVALADWPGPGLPPRPVDLTARALYAAHGLGAGDPALAAGRLPAGAAALVPLVVLLAVGYRHAGGYVGASASQAVLAGASSAVGYAAAGGALALLLDAGASAPAAALAFAVWGVVWGGLGGYVSRP